MYALGRTMLSSNEYRVSFKYCRRVSILIQWQEGANDWRCISIKHDQKVLLPCMVLIQPIKSIAPMITITPSTHISDTQTMSAINHSDALFAWRFLPASGVAFQTGSVCCLFITWLTLYQCPSCYSTTPLDPVYINPAPSLILELLGDILLSCSIRKVDLTAGLLHRH